MILVYPAPRAFWLSGAEILFALSISETSHCTVYPPVTKGYFNGFFPSHTFVWVFYLVKNQVDTCMGFMVFMEPLTPLIIIFEIMLRMLFHIIFFASLCRNFCQSQPGFLSILLFSIQQWETTTFQNHLRIF